MGKRVVVESGRDRRALVADAGWNQLSVVSILAGVLVAYGAFTLLASIVGGILEATDVDTDITARWDDLGVAAGLVVAVLLFLSYLFGGYVAGRMARRAGVLQGAGVFLLGVVVAAAVAVIVRQLGDTDALVDGLRDLGLPTTGDEWTEVGTVAGLASLVGAVLGAVLGGVLGERWHATLLARAIDPDVGAEADARRAAELAADEARVRHAESGERVGTATGRRLRPAPEVDRADAGSKSGWYRDRNLDDVPDRADTRPDRADTRPAGADAEPEGADAEPGRPDSGTDRRPGGSAWYRDPNLDDVPDRGDDPRSNNENPVAGRARPEGAPPAGDPPT